MEKSLVLSVSIARDCYRHIQISESATLYDLHETIQESFDFDNDHMHAFFMNNRAWDRSCEYICPDAEELDGVRCFSSEVKLSKFNLIKGSKFLYIFDFGDNWRFQIKVLRVVDAPVKDPSVIKSVGEVSQYDYDDDSDV